MNALMPLMALAVGAPFDLHPAVKIALVVITVSPTPPIFPKKALKAGGTEAYSIGLLVAAAVLSVIGIPLATASRLRQSHWRLPTRIAQSSASPAPRFSCMCCSSRSAMRQGSSGPFVPLRLPKLCNLRLDPYERADITSNTYYQWTLENGYLVIAASTVVGEFLKTFKDFPPRQKAASFTIDQAMEKMQSVGGGGLH